MRISGVYKITNKLTGDFYIGSSKDCFRRFRQHCSANNYKNRPLYRAFNKYGIENFSFEILIYCDEEKRFEYENILIKSMFPKYNVFSEAYYIPKYKMPEHKKRAMSYKMSIDILQYDIYGNFIKKWRGVKPASKELGFSIKLDKRNLTSGGFVWVRDGDKLPDFDEIRKRICDYKKIKCKKIGQYNLDGGLIRIFEGVRLASKETNIDHRSINACANNKPHRKTAGGFIWKYKTEI